MTDEWLKNLKVGDKVFVNGYYSKSLKMVEKITPTGRIVVDGLQFIDGRHQLDKWKSLILEEATEEKIKKFKEDIFVNNMIKKLHDIKELDYTKAVEIYNILTGDQQ